MFHQGHLATAVNTKNVGFKLSTDPTCKTFSLENAFFLIARWSPKTRPGRILSYTATKILFMYSFYGNCAALVPRSTFMYLRTIYIFPGSVHIFSYRGIGRSTVEMYKSLTNTEMRKSGRCPRKSFSGNICFEFSALVLCSLNVHVIFYSELEAMSVGCCIFKIYQKADGLFVPPF